MSLPTGSVGESVAKRFALKKDIAKALMFLLPVFRPVPVGRLLHPRLRGCRFQSRRGFILLLQAIGMAVHEPPRSSLEPKYVCDAVRPLRRSIHPLHTNLEAFDVCRIGKLSGNDGGDILVAHRAALELPPRPIPAP
jgi:hypothetical protein